MQLKPGMRLRSAVCATEVIVVRGAGDLDVRCGGVAMVAPGTEVDPAQAIAAGGDGTLMGKRYADENTIELLCTKPGNGGLSLGDEALPVKGAKALPSSD